MKYRFIILALLFSTQIFGQKDYTRWVNPFVGTGGHGHTFPGATTPFGMVQLSPDTRIDGSWDGCSGYHYSDNTIYGFSHTHLSGTGCSDYGDIMLMPYSGEGSFENTSYASTFSHKNEKASPGYYSVKMNNGIRAELTTTARTGWHRYTFPKGKAGVVLDLRHRDALISGSIKIINDSTVAIQRVSRAWAQEQHAYAYLVFSQPFQYRFNEDSSKLLFNFSLKNQQALITRVGYSMVSEHGAELNLKSESKGMYFDLVAQNAKSAWNKELAKIEANDPDEEKMHVFYTALYHVMIHPNIAMDVDGSYRGRDNKIHQANGFTYYTVFSLWDTFRALHPLLSIIDRKRTVDFIKTFLVQFDEGGRLPVWELASNETDCMIGVHSIPVITDAYSKGITDFDLQKAIGAMLASTATEKFGFSVFSKQGFLMADDEAESVSKTLEYAYDFWCIAKLQLMAGNYEGLVENIQLSNAWKNLFDRSTGFMRPRKNGGWLSPFEPREVNNHYTEGNAWQYRFFVPHDIDGLIQAMGGSKAFETNLDALFSAPSQTTGRTQADITGLIGQYAHGNEPSHHMAYLYNYVKRQDKSKKLIHKILKEFYRNEPDGLIGNEDCGQMSAWYVMSALGIYQVCPGTPSYCIIDPFLTSYQIQLESGKHFNDQLIRGLWNQQPFIQHAELIQTFLPTYDDEKGMTKNISNDFLPAPVIWADSASFNDSLKIIFRPQEKGSVIYDFIDHNDAALNLMDQGDSILWIKSSGTVAARSKWIIRGEQGQKIGEAISLPVYGKFFKNPHPNWEVQLKSKYNVQYSAGGPKGIIDGIQGTVEWRKGEWQGFQSQDFEVIVDMKAEKNISHFTASFLQDTRSWILMPTEVEYYVSTDGTEFKKIASVNNDIAPNDYNLQIKSFTAHLSSEVPARYVKVHARNFGKLPNWHAGSGDDAFIFVDELDFK